jgi:drug/metabolite transporter (DMT)-like permease
VSSRRLAGIALALVSATSFGVMPVLTKVVYADGADPIGVLSVRFALAAVVLLLLARLRGEALPRGRTLRALLLLGGVGYVTQSLCYFFALETISAGLVSLLLYFYPAIVVVLAALLLRDRPRPVALLCVGVATVGTILTIGPVEGGQAVGVALGIGSAVAYSLYILGSSRVHGVGSFATAGTVLSACAVVYAGSRSRRARSCPRRRRPGSRSAGVALFGTVIAVTTFFAALALLGPSDTAVVSTVEPVVSIGVAAVALGRAARSGADRGGRARAARRRRARPLDPAREEVPHRHERRRAPLRPRPGPQAVGHLPPPGDGRHHHIGAAPELQPLLGEDGSTYVGTSSVQLASRTLAQLQEQRARIATRMAAAAQALEFEQAAALRDDLAAVDAELARRDTEGTASCRPASEPQDERRGGLTWTWHGWSSRWHRGERDGGRRSRPPSP